jgi:transcription elongation factor Elf1
MKCPRCNTELKMIEDLPELQIFVCAECKLKITCEEMHY